MIKGIKIITIITGVIIISLVILYLTGNIKGYHYKTDMLVNNYPIYRYKNLGSNYCEGFHEVTLYEDEEYKYYVVYYCNGDGYFIYNNHEYIKLDVALKKGLITERDLKESDINVLKREK